MVFSKSIDLYTHSKIVVMLTHIRLPFNLLTLERAATLCANSASTSGKVSAFRIVCWSFCSASSSRSWIWRFFSSLWENHHVLAWALYKLYQSLNASTQEIHWWSHPIVAIPYMISCAAKYVSVTVVSLSTLKEKLHFWCEKTKTNTFPPVWS